jgi:hypothetical protein
MEGWMRWTWTAALLATAALRSAVAATALDALVLVPEATVNLDLTVPPGPRAVLPREPVHYTPSGAVLVALGLPVGAAPSVRAFHQGPDGSIYFSLSVPLTLSGTAFEPRDVIRWNGTLHTRHFHGSARGVPAGVSIAAFAQDAGGSDLLAFEQAFTLPTSGLAITRFDVVRWPSTGNPVLWLETDAVGASTAVLGIDGVSRLANGRVLFSFAARGLVGGVPREDEDVLEYDPASGAWDLSVDSSDLDPDWSAAGVRDVYAELGPANVGVPDPVRLRMLEIDPGANPARYALRMACGPHRVHDVSLGVIVSPNFERSDLRIGPCWFDGCDHPSPRFGPSVDARSALVDFSPDPATQRSDAVYVSLAGIGSAPLCSPGQDVLLAEVEIANNRSPFLPAPALSGEGAGPSHREGGALLPSELIVYESGSEAELWKVFVRPADGSGLLYEVLLDSALRFNRLTAALIPPEGVEANQVSFGGCTIPGDPGVTQRLCTDATELGPYVDRGLSSTFGPDPRIGPLGGHPTALYLELHGSAPTGSRLPALNFSRKPIRLGLLRYAPNVVEKVPPAVLAVGLGGLDPFNDNFTTDEITPTSGSIGGTGGSPGGDSDGDGQADDQDNCVGSLSQSDSGGVGSNVPDGIGNDCQCGDVVDSAGSSTDGIIDQSDVVRIRRALVGAESISPAAALKCNVQGAVDGTLSPLGLRKDCELRERVVLGRALAGQLGASPDLQKCAAP